MQARRLPLVQSDQMVAGRFQSSLLARECPECADTACVSALYQPAMSTGGDFYDIIPAGDEQRWFLIGDVCSRGTQSAMLMSLVLGYLWGAARAPAEPVEVARSLNEFLLVHKGRIPDAEMVSTLFLGLLDLPTLTMRFINAGHPMPMVQRHAARRTETFGRPGVLLGVEARADWVQQEVEFSPGDRMVLYTDGMLTAHTVTGETLGSEGLVSLLDASISESDLTVLKRLAARLANPGAFGVPEDDRAVMLTSFLDADKQ